MPSKPIERSAPGVKYWYVPDTSTAAVNPAIAAETVMTSTMMRFTLMPA